jgi:DNA repair protein RecO
MKNLQAGEANPELFDILKDVLKTFALNGNYANALMFFYAKYLMLAGLSPEFNKCSGCHEKISSNAYIENESGDLNCEKCCNIKRDTKISLDSLKVLHFLKTANITKATNLQIPHKIEKELFSVLKQLLLFLY